MWQSLKIVNRYYWKSLFGPGIMFILSVLMLFVVTSCLDLGALVKPFMAIPGIFCSMILLYGMLFIPVTINDLRGSIVMKRISSSRITTFQFLLTLLIYYFVFTIISYLWYIAWGFLIFVNKINEYINALQMINIGGLLYATLISYLLSVFFGFFVLIFTKRNYVVCIVAFIFLIYGLAFATYIAPIALVHNLTIIPGSTTDYRATDLYYFVYIDPFWFTTSMSYEAFFSQPSYVYNILGSSIFNPTVNLELVFANALRIGLTHTDKWLNLFVPLVLIVVLALCDVEWFKWNIR